MRNKTGNLIATFVAEYNYMYWKKRKLECVCVRVRACVRGKKVF